jgi:hypothetical protein
MRLMAWKRWHPEDFDDDGNLIGELNVSHD